MKKINRRAGFNYELLDKLEVGVVLTGAEAKAVRNNHIDLTRSFARLMSGELFLVNASIPLDNMPNYQATRSRKLLLHKRELKSLIGKMGQLGLTLVPTKVYTKGRRVKLEIALARSRRLYQKKQVRKLRDIKRDIERELRVKE